MAPFRRITLPSKTREECLDRFMVGYADWKLDRLAAQPRGGYSD